MVMMDEREEQRIQQRVKERRGRTREEWEGEREWEE
jgi:hypothetical protein